MSKCVLICHPLLSFPFFKQDGLLSSEYKHRNYEVFMEKRNLYDVKCAAFLHAWVDETLCWTLAL